MSSYAGYGFSHRSTRLLLVGGGAGHWVVSGVGHPDCIVQVFEHVFPCFALACDIRLLIDGRPPPVVRFDETKTLVMIVKTCGDQHSSAGPPGGATITSRSESPET